MFKTVSSEEFGAQFKSTSGTEVSSKQTLLTHLRNEFPGSDVGTWNGEMVMVKYAPACYIKTELDAYHALDFHESLLKLLAVVTGERKDDFVEYTTHYTRSCKSNLEKQVKKDLVTTKEIALVFEYPAQGTVADFMNSKIDETTSRLWMIQTARALRYMNSKNYIHNNLTPYYCYVTGTGNIKIGGLHCANNKTFMGTIKYCAPEQMWDYNDSFIKVGTNTDVFIFAMCMPAFYGKDYTISRVERGSFDAEDYRHDQAPDSLDLPSTIRKLMYKCLRLHPTQRPTMENVVLCLIANDDTLFDAICRNVLNVSLLESLLREVS